MNCKDFKMNVAAFALGALDPREHAQCQAHIEKKTGWHFRCNQALERARRTVERLALAIPAGAMPRNGAVWRRIERCLVDAGQAAEPQGSFLYGGHPPSPRRHSAP